MTSVVMNADAFFSGIDTFNRKFHESFRRRVERLMTEGMARMLRKTPVNTGTTLANYVATAGSPYRGAVIKGNPKPVEATNHLALGVEQLRPEFMRLSATTLTSVDYRNPFRAFWITNRSKTVGGLEAGELPHDPYVPRSPNGMFRVTIQELVQLLDMGKV
jgi:hypothetical protein